MHTQVVIIGGGPAGSLLSHLLHREGIESIVLERRSRDYVLSRIPAGVLHGTIQTLKDAGSVTGWPSSGSYPTAPASASTTNSCASTSRH